LRPITLAAARKGNILLNYGFYSNLYGWVMDFQQQYDVIVIGGGHAGTEAALAAARMGAATLLLTHNFDTLGQMSCNPAIGGIGKGHLVKEIDAMGGLMATAADHAGIHFRCLNASKGPAVRATRAQADRALYRQVVRQRLEAQPNLQLFQQAVNDLIVEGERVTGVITQMGVRFSARAVILTVGTFLGGRIHIGEANYQGGRAGDPSASALASRLRELPLRVGRLKTGTPPRLDGRSLDFGPMIAQPGDEPLPVFSFLGRAEQHPEQRLCYITRTREKTHDIIRSGLSRSPMYSGVIQGSGPRYCPSVEDKVVRFADKTSHQVFIEPEGLDTHEVYPNGISTSLPFDIQLDLVRSIPGCEQAHITRPGYAIEYDYFDPRELTPSLQNRYLHGLFFAGQINGTTGYEEAAAQGLLAGINAALLVRDQEPWFPGREQAYLGVLVDDLVTNGTTEPYRMFTSRAEYRLLLREDNADLRLTEQARRLGLIDDDRWRRFNLYRDSLEQAQQYLRSTWIRPDSRTAQAARQVLDETLGRELTLMDLLRRPGVDYQCLQRLPDLDLTLTDAAVIEQVNIQAKYAGYIDRQQQEIERQRRHQQTSLPDHLDYTQVSGLSSEVQQKLIDIRPTTLGQAARISGVTPAAISLLLVHLKKRSGELQRQA